MPSNELKQRKKNISQKQNDDSSDGAKQNGEPETKKSEASEQKSSAQKKSLCSDEMRRVLCLLFCLCLCVCASLACMIWEQNKRFAEVEEKYSLLHGRTATYAELEQRVETVSEKCDNLLALLRTLENEAPLSQVSGLEQELSQLTAWSSGATERRQQAQEKVLALARAVERIEQHTSSITRDMNAKVAAVRTDIRRMGGLESDVESLLARTGELEDKASEVERTMIKRMGELLVGSIDRVTSLKSATERNAQRLEQMRKQTPELLAADRRLSERILALESGRARLMRTVTFAGDLKPKVFTIQRDFTALEPRLDDLTLRIGQLAEHVMKSEKDLGELSESLASLSVAQGGVTELLVEQVVAMTSDPNNQPTHTSNLTEPVDVSLPSGEQ
ncbi:inhibitor of nuclear factor kappa-B kinase-interacting protein isoform X2 [Clupea harengus]|uniref:Inhibitor of nuclear factor kappa-B kinase-interacting protein isoform X2 n=1 Tax=Clupea harengus TaxID=7950 RepID=A0A8M1KQ13_CLUHA|nr:inhibitor of nuclear factor kappa-B kinase-interacting protein isoform X2 [Clupea harengus]